MMTTGVLVTTGNSQECRAYHAGVALAGLTTHCEHAGAISGGGSAYCGTECEAYCTQMMATCVAGSANQQYSTYAQCLSVCAAFPATGTRTPLDTTGDTIQCRMYHALVAGTDSTTTTAHCPHAGPTGGGQCGTPCDAYCDVIQAACGTSGTDSQFSSTATCLTSCAAYATSGTFDDSTGDTLQCRMYHATVALAGDTTAKTTHCPHAGVTSDPTYCGASTTSSGSMASSTAGTMTGTGSVSGAAIVQASVALIASMAAALLLAKQL
jgi:hypothetical protein